MPRKLDRSCCVCSKPMWGGKGALPQGEAMCRGCRSTARLNTGEHGTRLMYRQRGCRCAVCRSYIRDYMRSYTAVVRERDGRTPTQKARPRMRPVRNCTVCGDHVTGNASSDTPMHNDCRPPVFWKNSIQVSRRERLMIYERDKWTCQLCKKPVDPDLDPQDRMAATLDHIVPRTLTLFPDDSPENLRLAHRACNSERGNRVVLTRGRGNRVMLTRG